MIAGIFKKVQLLRGIISREKAYTGPFFVRVDITNRCNMTCLGCPYHSSKQSRSSPVDSHINDMSFSIVEKICNELPNIGTKEVIIVSEGEPFLHQRLFDIISAFKKAGLSVQLFTNGTLITEENILKMFDSGLDILTVSLWANSIEEYEKCHPGVKTNQFTKILSNIKIVSKMKRKLKSKTPLLFLKQPINRFNFRSIDTRIDLAVETGCDAVFFDTHRHREFTSAVLTSDNITFISETLIQAKKRLENLRLHHNIDKVVHQFHLGRYVWRKLPCYIGWYYTCISTDGTVGPCTCAIPLGNLNESSFAQIWNGEKYREFRRTSVTVKGLETLKNDCDCDWCCMAKDNFKVHSIFKWIAPFISKE